MKKKRKIIEIDEEKCNGCGQCILSCAEGALELVDGKARLVGEIFCDGIGDCIGECPTGALRIVEREAEDFDEKAAVERMAQGQKTTPSTATQPAPGPVKKFQCPHTAAMTFQKKQNPAAEAPGERVSHLGHWPIKLALLNPSAPFLDGAELLLLADCAAAAFPDLHRKFLKGCAVAMACPKLDDLDLHIAHLTGILKGTRLKALTILRMEVPCCGGLEHAVQKAIEAAGVAIPVKRVVVSRYGEILSEEVG